MFEKDAEEIANKKLCATTMCYGHCSFSSPKHHRCGDWHRCYEIAKEGAEFGYNKAKAKIQEKLKADLIADLKERMQYSTSPSCTKGMELFIRSIEEWEIKEIVLPKESE